MPSGTFIYSIENIATIADALLLVGKNIPVWLFHGEMGAGKTTLITALARKCGVKGEISSPTYALVNEYVADGNIIYHMDAFRIKNTEEALDAGIEEYLFSNNFCWIEWPEQIAELIPEHYFDISISGDGAERTLTYNTV